MEDVIKEIFLDSFSQTIATYSEVERPKVAAIVVHICGEIRPYMAVTDSGAEAISNQVFTDALYRDFILSLLFNFTGRLKFRLPNYSLVNIAESFAEGLSPDSPAIADPREFYNGCKVPDEIIQRIANYNTAKSLLATNKWLLMILFVIMYVDMQTIESTYNVKTK